MPPPALIATHARTGHAATPWKQKAEKQARTAENQAKESIIGDLERKIAQLVTSARVKHERENQVRQHQAVPGNTLD